MNRKRNRSPGSKYGRTADPHEWYSPSCIWPLGDSLEPSTLFWPWRFFSGKFAYIEVRNVTRSILLTHSKPGGVHFLIGWMTAKVKSPLQWEVLLQRRAEALKLGLPSRRPPLYLSGLSGASVFSSLGFPFLPHTCCGRWYRPQPGEESRPHLRPSSAYFYSQCLCSARTHTHTHFRIIEKQLVATNKFKDSQEEFTLHHKYCVFLRVITVHVTPQYFTL